MHSILKAVVVIRIDVAVVDGSQALAALENAFDGPATSAHATRGFGGPVVDDAEIFVIRRPAFGHSDSRVGMNCLVSVKIQSNEERWFFCVVRKIDEDVHEGAALRACKKNAHLL